MPDSPEWVMWQADVLDHWWEMAGRPDPYTLVEVGAGDGSRARQLLQLGPECLVALRMVLVEPAQSEAHRRGLPIEDPAFLFPVGPVDPDDPDAGPLPAVGVGPLVTTVPALPVVDGEVIVILWGWLSRLPADRFEWRDGRWWEVRLAAVDPGSEGTEGEEQPTVGSQLPPGLTEMLVPVDRVPSPIGRRPIEGQRVADPVGALSFLSEVLRMAPSGVVLAVDRWTVGTTGAVSGAGLELDVERLANVRAPFDMPTAGPTGELAVVSWRLG